MGKTISITEEIMNRRNGSYRFCKSDRNKLDNILKEIHNKNLFDKFKMGYVVNYDDNYMNLIIHRELDFESEI